VSVEAMLSALFRYRLLLHGKTDMPKIVFVVEMAPEGGYKARALGAYIFTEADTEAELKLAVQDAVHCHFDDGSLPKVIRLHFVRDELMAA
jgi:hypothetical protein